MPVELVMRVAQATLATQEQAEPVVLVERVDLVASVEQATQEQAEWAVQVDQLERQALVALVVLVVE
jgi:hypothetical protein